MSTTRMAMGLALVLAVGGMLSHPLSAEAQRGMRSGQAAPEITGGPWINSEPLSLKELRGRVVYLEFWTYG